MKSTFMYFIMAFSMLLGINVNAQSIYGLSGAGTTLIKFSATDPALTNTITITGVAVLGPLVGIDFRPATGELFGIGYTAVGTQVQLYSIDTATGAADTVGGPVTLSLGVAGLNTAFDFNPTVDRIRVITEADSNFRLNPLNGQIAARDTNLMFVAADANAGASPNINTVAYTNSFMGATSTTLYGYDNVLDALVTISPPNRGSLNTVGSSGMDFDNSVDFDISKNNVAYLVGNTTGGNDSLYTMNLQTGAVNNMGIIGNGVQIDDIAIANNGQAPTAVIEATSNIGVSLYPNPATSYVNITVTTEGAEVIIINVTDIAGKVLSTRQVKGGGQYNGQIDLSSFAPGAYLISIQNGQQKLVRTINKY